MTGEVLNRFGKPAGKAGRPAGSGDMFPGRRFGYLEFLGFRKTKAGLRLKVQCHAPKPFGAPGEECGKQILTKTQYLTRKPNPQVHCGCQKELIKNPYRRERGIWHMMHTRTENPNHVSWAHYGGRGIKVCPEWNKKNPEGFKNFIAFVGGAPTPSHSIDRVNPNLGYQPYMEDGVTRQVRWATSKEQANNQRHHWKG